MLRDLPGRDLILSGSFGAEQIVSVAPPALLLVYSEGDARSFVDAAGLLPAVAGANVIIAKPYDAVIVERLLQMNSHLPARVPIVAASQLAIDCLTGTGRMPQEGEALLGWMAEDENRWRLPTLGKVVPAAST
jgi:hypothetical protein